MPGCVGNPAVGVAVATVIDVFELVNGMAGQGAGSRGLRAERRHGNIGSTGVKDLQFIQARLAARRGKNREAKEPGLGGGEGILVRTRIYWRAQCLPAEPRALGGFRLLSEFVEGRFVFLQFAAELHGQLLVRWIHARPQRPFGELHAGEHRLHGIIILLRNGIELVIVTARTPEGQPQKYRAGGVDDVGQFVLPLHQGEIDVGAFDDIKRPGDQESRAGIGTRTEDVPGNLLPDELIVGLVRVERLDDVVAIRMRIAPFAIRLETIRVGVADDVQPVTRPAFAVARAGQDLIHQAFPRVLPGVGHETGDLIRCGRKAVHYQIEATDQGPPIGLRAQLQLLRLQFRGDEGVDGQRDARVANGGHRGTDHGLKRPPGGSGRAGGRRRHFGRRGHARPDRQAHQEPGPRAETAGRFPPRCSFPGPSHGFVSWRV